MKLSPKEELSNSLMELLKSCPFDEITVGDITQNCGVSRTTFYRNFRDKYDCMNWVYCDRINKIVEENSEIASWRNLVYQIAVFLYEKKDYFAKVNNYAGQNSLTDCIYQCGMNYANDLVKKELGTDTIPRDTYYLIHMYVFGTVSGIDRWLRDGCAGGPDFLADVQSLAMPEGLRQFFV